MMDLKTQIVTLLFSFGYGILIAILLSIFYKLLYHKKVIYQIISSFLLIISSSLIYFIIMQKLNNAILHPYFILMFILGFIAENVSVKGIKKIVEFVKK